MASDYVRSFVADCLVNQGFKKVKKAFVKNLGDCKATIEFHNNSFEKAQNFIELTLEFHSEVATSQGLTDCFATWCRVESLDPKMKLQNLEALNENSVLSQENRNQILEKIIETDLSGFIQPWSNFVTAESAYKAAKDKHAPINAQLKIRWEG
jgi:hypothetical protein